MQVSWRRRKSSRRHASDFDLNPTFHAAGHSYGEITASGHARLHQGDHYGDVINQIFKDEEVAQALEKEKGKRRRLQRDLESLRGDRQERIEYQEIVDQQLELLQTTERDKRRKLERRIDRLKRNREEQVARQRMVDEQLQGLRGAIEEAKKNEKALQRKLDKAIAKRSVVETSTTPTSNVQHWTYSSSSTVADHRWANCLTMCGSYYFFVGLKWCSWSLQSGFLDCFNTTTQTNYYVSLGTNGSWLRFYKEGGREYGQLSDNLRTEYPALDSYIRDRSQWNIPTCCSLGENGTFFARTAWGVWYSLPNATTSHLGDPMQMRHVWLGKGGAYVAVGKNGGMWWNVQGYYGALEKVLKSNEGCLEALALNLTDGETYFAVWNTGTWSWRTSGNTVSSTAITGWLKSTGLQ